MKLLRTLILRPLRRDLLRSAMTLLAVALGVAVVVAIDLAGDAATSSFRSSLETLTGKTDLEITANGGIDEQWIGRLAGLPINARFTPWVEANVRIEGIGSVPFYGIDMVAGALQAGESQQATPGLVASEALAHRLGVQRGARINVEVAGVQREFTLGSITEAGSSEFLALDIAEAQRLLDRYGKVDRIDVVAAPGEDFSRVEAIVRSTLPAGYFIEKPGSRSAENQRMLRAFQWNLHVLSYISLVVGAFLIYTTISISVARRRGEIGILRALGASRGAVLALFLAEAMVFGLAGSALGVVAGRALAGGSVRLVSATVNALFTTSRPAPVELSGGEIWIAIAAGSLAALASALGPAHEAAKVHPTEAMSRGAREHVARAGWQRGLKWCAAFAVLSLLAAQAGPVAGFPLFGYAAAFLAIASATAAAPALVVAANRVARNAFKSRVEGRLAGRSLAGSLPRTSAVVAALATAIAMMVSVGLMVSSFRETVSVWLDIQLRADLFVRSAVQRGAGPPPPLPSAMPALLLATPGVGEIGVLHSTELRYGGERATIGGGDIEVLRRHGGFRFVAGEDRDAVMRSLIGHDRGVISEPFANKFGVRVGDRIKLPLGASAVVFTVAGIYYDYSSPQGWVIVDSATLLKYLPDLPATSASAYLAPGADLTTVEREVRNRAAALNVTVEPNRELRRISMEIFDRTFAITWAVEGVAILVAMLGAANALLAVVLDRRRELALLRYLGMSKGQVRGMILAEAAWIGGLASALGLALGFALSLLLILVVNKQSFGWTIQFHPPGVVLAVEVALIWAFTILAGLYPARIAVRFDPAEAIHEE